MRKSLLFFVCLSLIGCTHKSPIALQWELGQNDIEPGYCEVILTLTNLTDSTLGSDWKMYFNLMSLHPVYTEGDALRETEIQASWHSLKPTEKFQPLAPHAARSYAMRYRGSAIRENILLQGPFIILGNGKPITVPFTWVKYSRPEQMKRGIETWEKTPYADGEYVFEYNRKITEDSLNRPERDLLPVLPQPKQVVRGEGTCNLLTAPVTETTDANVVKEGYILRLTPDGIRIEASDASGIFYAKQTLEQLKRHATEDQLSAYPALVITDYPDLPHRGIMLDIVRNYYPLDSIKRVVDVMAAYKLNVLHMHLSDDEGWRLEIPGLPELTKVASKRGYTETETDCLLPMYNGGWDPNDRHSTANGYLTRKEYIDLLRYAQARGIRVIPEIDMPGHMRACKKAMHGLLTDSVLEKREYLSAQNYTDNVIAVSNPYAVEFIDKVITEIVKMYADAGCELTIFNIGGDEVPNGSLTREEHQAYIDAVLAILNRYNLQPMGWEEIGHFCPPETRAICYSWHNEKKSAELAEAGYQVVLAAATHLYFDFAYCKHHEEKGLDWGGFTNEYSAFDWEPLQHENVVGMNAQLWAEVIRSFSQVEWQIYPKVFGLCERAWNNRSELTLQEYNRLVYHYGLPDLHAGNHNFHLQQPGIHVDSTMTVTMNHVTDRSKILYTLDDKEWQEYTQPFTIDSAATSIIKAKVQYLDHESNTTWRWL